jgi:hypothetical protein
MVRVLGTPMPQPLRQLLEHVGLIDSAPSDWSRPMPTLRTGAGVGIGPAISGRESNPAPRPRPSPSTMRSERSAPPRRP